MDPVQQGWAQIQSGTKEALFHASFKDTLFKNQAKWRAHYCAIYTGSQYGKARMEIFISPEQYSMGKQPKVLLLSECVAIRPINLSRDNPMDPLGIQVQLESGRSEVFGFSHPDEAQAWLTAMSRAAFPEHYQMSVISKIGAPTPISSPVTESPPIVAARPSDSKFVFPASDEEPAYEVPWDSNQMHVLLVSCNGSYRSKLPEGNYDLCFKDSLVLKDGQRVMQAWNYDDITWFGLGDGCIALEVAHSRVFEFSCAQPDKAKSAMQSRIPIMTPTDIVPINMKYYYSRKFVGQQKRQLQSSVKFREGQMQPKLLQPSDFSTASFISHVPESGTSKLDLSTDSHHSERITGAQRPKEQKSKRFSLFRRSQKEKKLENVQIQQDIASRYPGYSRDDFEQRANTEWVLYGRPQQNGHHQNYAVDYQYQTPRNTLPPIALQNSPNQEIIISPYSPSDVTDPRSSRPPPPQQQQQSTHTAVTTPTSPGTPFSPTPMSEYPPNIPAETTNAHSYPNPTPLLNQALSFKQQLERTIAARRQAKSQAHNQNVPKLADDTTQAGLPTDQKMSSPRNFPTEIIANYPRLRDSIVSEPPGEMKYQKVFDARMGPGLASIPSGQDFFDQAQSGRFYGQSQQPKMDQSNHFHQSFDRPQRSNVDQSVRSRTFNESEQLSADPRREEQIGLPLVASDYHRPKQIVKPRLSTPVRSLGESPYQHMKVTKQESLID